jgi:hypothetical protein
MFRNSMCAVATAIVASLLLSAFGASAATSGGINSPPTSTTSPATTTSVNQPTSSPFTPTSTTPTTPPVTPAQKSAKRGVAYDLADPLDFAALSPGVSWWYNWAAQPNKAVPADYVAQYGMDYYPMLWNGNFDATAVESFLQQHAEIHYLLVVNEPNLTSQSNLTPQQAAALWPRFEAIAAHSAVKIVGPQITWGTMPNYQDPVAWLDAFIAAYQAANGGRNPQIDYLGFHWYDYGLAGQLDRLKKYGKSFWITEFANWHSQNDGAQIDTLAKQEAQMKNMVAICESRSDVFRYAWFTGRWSNDVHFTSLLSTPGQLTDLGKLYLSLPYTSGGTAVAIPGTLQAENYDTGGPGIAYNVKSKNGSGNSYRSDAVDLEPTTDTGGGYDLGWTSSGQWFRYTVNVASAGTYTVSFRVAALNAVTDAFHLSNSSGTNLSGSVAVPATRGWQTWTTVTTNVTLAAGQQVLTLNEDSGGWNINYATFAAVLPRAR